MIQQARSGPLAGINVLELATFITGPVVGNVFAALGADVIKVETSDGDPFRGPGGYNPAFCAVNFDKRSVTLDLRDAEARRSLHALAANADVVIENYRPGVAERLGVTHEALRAINPRLVYCSISGLGQTSALAALASYDTVAQAYSGLLSTLTLPDDPTPVGPPIADMVTGLFATISVLAALVERGESPSGRRISLSMLSSTLALLSPIVASYGMTGEVPDPLSRTKRSQAFGLVASDGLPFVVHLSTPAKFWQALANVIGRPDLLSEARFATWDLRVEHYDELATILREAARARTRAEWLQGLRSSDVPCAPVYRLDETFADEELAASEWLVRAEHPAKGAAAGILFPARFDGWEPLPPSAPPMPGEHNGILAAGANAWRARERRRTLGT